jgi:3-dehydroquinate synthase
MIADDTVYQLYRSGRLGRPVWNSEVLTVPAGEQVKSRETWARLTDDLLERRFGRDSGVVSLGGGVIGDLAGFVAATYMRGLPYLQLPTTLLAMVDASVGGKTGVNTAHGKNLVGAFHPPVAVVADPLVLATLPSREYRAGLAEAVKHGLIADGRYFEWMEAHQPALLNRDPETVAHLVRRSVQIKAAIVSEDEREAGKRVVLNAGHTVAHALERSSDYQMPHGEAVALGLLVECAIAEQLHLARAGLGRRVAALLQGLGLPLKLSRPLDRGTLMNTMARDKKNRQDQIHFVLPREVGRMDQSDGWTRAVPSDAIGSALSVIE